MMLGVPVDGVVGSLGFTDPLAPGAVLRPLGLEVMPPWLVPKLPPGPLPTVGLVCGIVVTFGTLDVLPGPEPPGTPTPPGLNPPVVPVVAPPVAVPLGAEPLPLADPAPPPAPPELCAKARVEPARKVKVTAIESFMTEPAASERLKLNGSEMHAFQLSSS